MGKWFSHSTYFSNKKMLDYHKTDDPSKIEYYYPWVIQIANTFPRDAIAIGCLTINDLVQAGMVGLVEGWARVDLDRDQPEIWSFLKTRIKGSIRREIDNNGATIKVPRIELEKHRKNLTKVEKTIVNIFPKFFSRMVIENPDVIEPFISLQLEDIIVKELNKVEKNTDNIDILLKFYGIGFEKLNHKELAEKYNKNISSIQNIVSRTKNKLKTKEFEELIENFYQNQ